MQKGIFLGPTILKSFGKQLEKKMKQTPPKTKDIILKTKNEIIKDKQEAESTKKDKPSKNVVGRKTHDTKLLTNGIFTEAPGGDARDTEDHTMLRHNRDRNIGFKIGNYVQTPPLLFSRDGHAIYLGDIYRGSSAFLIAGGPSFKDVDKEKLSSAGFVTLGLNNSVKSYRPNLWTCVDDPTHFIKSIWLDPKITKFAPFAHADKKIFDNEAWKEMDITVGDCPNVLYYRRNESFNAEQFLFEDSINWGNHTKLGGGRSVMLAAIRILFYLGIRKVFLLGVDFDMNVNNKYHFEQNRSESSISNNNNSYKLLQERFDQLNPIFKKYEFNVYNCNPNSKLKSFDFVSFDDAIQIATYDMPQDLANERTSGLYDRKANDKNEIKKRNIKNKLDAARKDLNDAKLKLKNTNKNSIAEKEYQELEKDIIDKRREFREIEKKKNLIWYGSPKKPEK